ncbi:helix-turn-helix domain-containing protein [Streptomyces sp. NPDC001939]
MIGTQVAALRAARGWTQAQLAEAARTTQAQVSRIEQGTVTPTLPVLGRLAAALGARLDVALTPVD